MSDERSTFETTKARLSDIVDQVKRKDVSLEASLDLLEEAVRLVNRCNDLIDQTTWRPAEAPEGQAAAEPGAEAVAEQAEPDASAPAVDGESPVAVEGDAQADGTPEGEAAPSSAEELAGPDDGAPDDERD